MPSRLFCFNASKNKNISKNDLQDSLNLMTLAQWTGSFFRVLLLLRLKRHRLREGARRLTDLGSKLVDRQHTDDVARYQIVQGLTSPSPRGRRKKPKKEEWGGAPQTKLW